MIPSIQDVYSKVVQYRGSNPCKQDRVVKTKPAFFDRTRSNNADNQEFTGRVLSACVPLSTFRLDAMVVFADFLQRIASKWTAVYCNGLLQIFTTVDVSDRSTEMSGS
jgi:hypothetical protein